MWIEIQEKSRRDLFHILFANKLASLPDVDDAISLDDLKPGDSKLMFEVPSDELFERYKIILNIFTEHEFL